MIDKLFNNIYGYIDKNAVNLSFFISICCLALVFWVRYILIFVQNPDLGGYEENVIYSIQRILAGFNLYENPELPPYSITQYSPLYYYLNFFLGKVFDVNPDKPFEVFILSRSVSLCLNVILLAVCFCILKYIFKVGSKLATIASVFTFAYLTHPIYSRPDSLFSLFFLITVLLFLYFLEAKTDKGKLLFLVLSSFASILTIYSKQSGILLPALLIFFLIFYLKNMKYVFISVFSLTLSFALLLLLTNGGNLAVFYQNVYKGIQQSIDVVYFYQWASRYLLTILIWNVLGFAAALFFLKRHGNLSIKFLSISMFGAFFFALLTGLKWGSSYNYFTEYLNLVFIILTIFIGYVNFNKNEPLSSEEIVERQSHGNKICCRDNVVFKTDKVRVVYFLIVLLTLPYLTLIHYGDYKLYYSSYPPGSYSKSEKVYQYLINEQKIKDSDFVLLLGEYPPQRHYIDNFLYRNNLMPTKKVVSSAIFPSNSPYDYSHFISNANNGLAKYLISRKSAPMRYMSVEFTNFRHIKDIEDFSIFSYSGPMKDEAL